MRRALLLLAGTVALAGCGGGSDEASQSAGPPIKTIEIAEKDYSFFPSYVKLAKPGTYEFRVTNNGAVPHGLEVEGKGVEEKTEEIDPGGKATLRFTVDKRGSYSLYCPVGNHRARGMSGQVVVGAAAAEGDMSQKGQTTTEDDAGGGGYGYGR